MEFGSVNRAAVSAMGVLLNHALELGILARPQKYGVVFNRPDADPFRQIFTDKIKLCPLDIETRRQGISNLDIRENVAKEANEWPRAQDRSVIVDSCIARGTTCINSFVPRILEMSRNVKKIACFVLLASEEGLARIDSVVNGSIEEFHVFTAAVDPQVNANGWIMPGVGPDSFTKRIPEKMGVTPLWSEYPLDLAKLSLASTIDTSYGWASTLDISLLWLIYLCNVNKGKPIGYQRLTKWVEEVDKYSGLYGTEHSITQRRLVRSIDEGSPLRGPRFHDVSRALDGLEFRELVKHGVYGYIINEVGCKYLDKVCIPVIEHHPTYGKLAEAIETLYVFSWF